MSSIFFSPYLFHRFGWFGIVAQDVSRPILNYCGAGLCLLRWNVNLQLKFPTVLLELLSKLRHYSNIYGHTLLLRLVMNVNFVFSVPVGSSFSLWKWTWSCIPILNLFHYSSTGWAHWSHATLSSHLLFSNFNLPILSGKMWWVVKAATWVFFFFVVVVFLFSQRRLW